MNAFEPLIWLGCAWCVVRAINREEPCYWIWFGVLAGLGMENKYTIVFFIAALVVALALTSARRFLATRQFWFGALIAVVVFLPNLIWLVRHGFPFLELMHNIRQTHRDVVRPPLAFVLDQAQIMNPATFPLWLGGLFWFSIARDAQRYRILGVTYLLLLAAFIALRGKNYYLTSIYPVLFAGGAVAFERITPGRWRWTQPTYAIILAVTTTVLTPLFSPILSPEKAIAYQRALGIEPLRAENQATGPLPQYFADEFGWEEMAREVARVYHALPPAEQARTAIFANSYGQAGAIDFFAAKYGLPQAVSSSLH